MINTAKLLQKIVYEISKSGLSQIDANNHFDSLMKRVIRSLTMRV